MSNTWKTPKGTTLYLLDLKGKPYLPVAERLIWFREEHPDWSIQTDFYQLNDSHAITRARIFDKSGNHLATAHKREDKAHFQDYTEKSETSAIGRALAMCGFGTQFTGSEFDEGERLADAPANRPLHKEQFGETDQRSLLYKDNPMIDMQKTQGPPSMQSAGDFVIPFGSEKGQTFKQAGPMKVSSALKWVKEKSPEAYRKKDEIVQFVFWAEAFLKKSPIDELDKALKAAPKKDEPPKGMEVPPWPTAEDEIPF